VFVLENKMFTCNDTVPCAATINNLRRWTYSCCYHLDVFVVLHWFDNTGWVTGRGIRLWTAVPWSPMSEDWRLGGLWVTQKSRPFKQQDQLSQRNRMTLHVIMGKLHHVTVIIGFVVGFVDQ